jgi:hypothetical protein
MIVCRPTRLYPTRRHSGPWTRLFHKPRPSRPSHTPRGGLHLLAPRHPVSHRPLEARQKSARTSRRMSPSSRINSAGAGICSCARRHCCIHEAAALSRRPRPASETSASERFQQSRRSWGPAGATLLLPFRSRCLARGGARCPLPEKKRLRWPALVLLARCSRLMNPPESAAIRAKRKHANADR